MYVCVWGGGHTQTHTHVTSEFMWGGGGGEILKVQGRSMPETVVSDCTNLL